MLSFITDNYDLVDQSGLDVFEEYGCLCNSTTEVDGSWACGIVDWEPQYREGFNFTTRNTVVNTFAVKSLQLLAYLAEALGYEEATKLQKQAERTKQAMLKYMYNSDTAMWCDGLCSELLKDGTYHSQHFAYIT